MPRILTAVVISLMVFSLSPALGQDQPATDELQWTVEEYPDSKFFARSYRLTNGCNVNVMRDGGLSLNARRGDTTQFIDISPGQKVRRTWSILNDGFVRMDLDIGPVIIYEVCAAHFPKLPAEARRLFRGHFGIE